MVAAKFATSVALFWMLTRPAGWGADVVVELVVFGGQGLPFAGSHVGALANGAPSVLNSTPADAVVSLDMIVSLIMFAMTAPSRETPAPGQPPTRFAMRLRTAR